MEVTKVASSDCAALGSSVLVLARVAVRIRGLQVLQDLDLAIETGVTTAVIGPNGSGKTTLLNVVSGFLAPNQGEIYLRGRRIDRLDPAAIVRLGLARTFQNTRVFGRLCVYDNLFLAMEGKGAEGLAFGLNPFRCYTTGALRERAANLLRQAKLDVEGSWPAANLSRGQRKLIELLRTLTLGVDVLLLDEPFAGLFPAQREVMFDLLQNLARSGKTILFVEHDMEAVRKLAERVVMLYEGRVFTEGSSREVLEDPRVADLYFHIDESA